MLFRSGEEKRCERGWGWLWWSCWRWRSVGSNRANRRKYDPWSNPGQPDRLPNSGKTGGKIEGIPGWERSVRKPHFCAFGTKSSKKKRKIHDQSMNCRHPYGKNRRRVIKNGYFAKGSEYSFDNPLQLLHYAWLALFPHRILHVLPAKDYYYYL